MKKIQKRARGNIFLSWVFGLERGCCTTWEHQRQEQKRLLSTPLGAWEDESLGAALCQPGAQPHRIGPKVQQTKQEEHPERYLSPGPAGGLARAHQRSSEVVSRESGHRASPQTRAKGELEPHLPRLQSTSRTGVGRGGGRMTPQLRPGQQERRRTRDSSQMGATLPEGHHPRGSGEWAQAPTPGGAAIHAHSLQLEDQEIHLPKTSSLSFRYEVAKATPVSP